MNIFDDLMKAMSPDTKHYELAAIHLEKKIILGSGPGRRVAPGETVRVNADGQLQDIEPGYPATHFVIKCTGKLDDTEHFIYLKELNSHKTLTLTL